MWEQVACVSPYLSLMFSRNMLFHSIFSLYCNSRMPNTPFSLYLAFRNVSRSSMYRGICRWSLVARGRVFLPLRRHSRRCQLSFTFPSLAITIFFPSLFNLMPITFCFSFSYAPPCSSPCSQCSVSLSFFFFVSLKPPSETRWIHHSTRLSSLPSTPEWPSSPHTYTTFLPSLALFFYSISTPRNLSSLLFLLFYVTFYPHLFDPCMHFLQNIALAFYCSFSSTWFFFISHWSLLNLLDFLFSLLFYYTSILLEFLSLLDQFFTQFLQAQP